MELKRAFDVPAHAVHKTVPVEKVVVHDPFDDSTGLLHGTTDNGRKWCRVRIGSLSVPSREQQRQMCHAYTLRINSSQFVWAPALPATGRQALGSSRFSL